MRLKFKKVKEKERRDATSESKEEILQVLYRFYLAQSIYSIQWIFRSYTDHKYIYIYIYKNCK